MTSPAPRHVWEEIVALDPDALPEHAPSWVDALCAAGGHSDVSRLYEFPDGRRFVLPLVRRRGVLGLGGWLTSYPAAWGIGGIVGAAADREVVDAVLADLRQVPAGRIWVRPNPLHARWWPDRPISARPSVTTIPRRAHLLDLSGDLDDVLARMSASTRQHIRQGRKRVTRVEIDHTGRLLPLHYQLYMTSVERWAARQHEPKKLAEWRARRRDSLHKLQTMARVLGENMAVQIAFVGERPAASSITLFGRTAHDIRAALDPTLAGHSRAGMLLQWSTIEMAHARGCGSLHLGESGESARLSHFKESFGATALRYNEVRIERVPYTRVDLVLRGGVKWVMGFRDT
ncbi:MAG TPA: GNAT family N-acetyltransferase [Actinomycetospora sp.]|uniref:GNAT family N-acetyltransferase n=1 Tax=Actinomycetospora sp. TaxID=1872135 RepID=UPI002F42260A